MTIERYLTRSAVFLIIKDPQGAILFQRRQNTGFMDGYLDLGASGHIEANETASQAAQRELLEETGLSVSLSRLSFVCVNHRKTGDYIYYDFYFLVAVTADEAEQIYIAEPAKNAQMIWLHKHQLTDDVIDYNRLVIENMEQNNHYYEIGW